MANKIIIPNRQPEEPPRISGIMVPGPDGNPVFLQAVWVAGFSESALLQVTSLVSQLIAASRDDKG